MKSCLAALFLSLCCSVPALAQTASGGLTARVEITRISASCSISGATNIDFGSLQRPVTGTGSATIDPTAAAASSFAYVDGSDQALTSSGSPTWGTATASASNASSMTVNLSSPPSELRRSGCTGASDASGACAATFALTWAGSDDASSETFTAIGTNASDVSNSLGGEGSSKSRFYRLGGTISGISTSTVAAVYEAAVTINVACPN